jgi:hypothetical protein
MNDREGAVITISRAEFALGPKHPRARSKQTSETPAIIIPLHPEPIEHDAKITLFPTNYSPESVYDESIEEMINTDIISSILGQLEVNEQQVDMDELRSDVIELREQGVSDQNILEYVLAYIEYYAPDIHKKALEALSIKEARELLIDFFKYSYERSSDTL